MKRLSVLLILAILAGVISGCRYAIIEEDSILVSGWAALAEGDSLLDEAALDQWIQDYLTKQGIGGGNQLFSVGFCYTATGDCWYYNPDQFMYSASLYKVPASMLAEGPWRPRQMLPAPITMPICTPMSCTSLICFA